MKTIAPEGAKGIDIRDYGAIPNDGIDDTAAIQKALDDERRDANGDPLHRDFYGRPKHLYFPAGTYDVSDTIDWVGNAVTLNGDGSGETIFKLQNNAAGFGTSEAPKAVIETSDGNTAFRNNIWNLSVDVGTGNAGAIGIDYGASNNGSMENVTISSGDGQGFIGLSMADGIPGPLLIKDVKVDGFDTGIKNSGPYSATFKNIELTNQNTAGMDAGGGTLVIHGLKSNNSVPAIKSDNWFEMVTVVDADLQGGTSNRSAIESQGQLYARDIETSGYQSAIEYGDEAIPGDAVVEYASQNSQLFDDSAQKSLNLPLKEFPEFNDSNLENWGRFEPRWYGDTGELQDLFDSGKSTIYFPADTYFSYNQWVITVPPHVKKIVGFSSIVNRHRDGENGGGIKFVVEGDSKDPLIVEGFGYGITVENQTARDVALKNGKYSYVDGPGSSDLYIENIEIGRLDLRDTQNVYAWQLNTESLHEARTKVTNSGADMVVFGIKTEGKGTVIETVNGGKTEVLGGVILPVQPFSDEDNKEPAFSIVDSEGLDSEGSVNIRFRHYESPDRMYDILVEETQDGETRQLKTSGSPHEFLTLYSGNQTVGAQSPEPSNPDPAPEPTPAPKANETIGEYGNLNLDHKWTTVSLDESYSNPVVIVSDPTANGSDPAAVRLRNVTGNTFQIRLQEPNYKDDKHKPESVSYLVMEAGDWTLDDGTRISAGRHTSSRLTSKGFDTIKLQDFNKTPTVLSQVQSYNGSDWVTTRTTGQTETGFQLAMQEEEALNDGGHAKETIGWLAIEQGAAADGDTLLQSKTTARSYDHDRATISFQEAFDTTPSVIAKLGSYFGPNTANVRLDEVTSNSFGIGVQEEQSQDAELNHVDEAIAFLALEGPSGSLTGLAA